MLAEEIARRVHHAESMHSTSRKLWRPESSVPRRFIPAQPLPIVVQVLQVDRAGRVKQPISSLWSWGGVVHGQTHHLNPHFAARFLIRVSSLDLRIGPLAGMWQHVRVRKLNAAPRRPHDGIERSTHSIRNGDTDRLYWKDRFERQHVLDDANHVGALCGCFVVLKWLATSTIPRVAHQSTVQIPSAERHALPRGSAYSRPCARARASKNICGSARRCESCTPSFTLVR